MGKTLTAMANTIRVEHLHRLTFRIHGGTYTINGKEFDIETQEIELDGSQVLEEESKYEYTVYVAKPEELERVNRQLLLAKGNYPVQSKSEYQMQLSTKLKALPGEAVTVANYRRGDAWERGVVVSAKTDWGHDGYHRNEYMVKLERRSVSGKSIVLRVGDVSVSKVEVGI